MPAAPVTRAASKQEQDARRGAICSRSGVSYRGEFRDDRYHGLGTLEWPDGGRYWGRFVRGEPEGEGLRSNAEGEFSQTFKNGMLGAGAVKGEDGERFWQRRFSQRPGSRQGPLPSGGEVWATTSPTAS